MLRIHWASRGRTVSSALRHLADERCIVFVPADSISMAHPFSGIKTDFVVTIGQQQWFANCAWDGLSILALFGDGSLDTHSPPLASPCALRFTIVWCTGQESFTFWFRRAASGTTSVTLERTLRPSGRKASLQAGSRQMGFREARWYGLKRFTNSAPSGMRNASTLTGSGRARRRRRRFSPGMDLQVRSGRASSIGKIKVRLSRSWNRRILSVLTTGLSPTFGHSAETFGDMI